MTTPNHAGWTESNNAIAARSQRRRAVELAYEVYTKSALTEQEIDALEGAMEAAMTDPAHIATAPQLGPQEPPDDYRIYNRRRPDGTFPPLSGFFAVRQADAGNVATPELVALNKAAGYDIVSAICTKSSARIEWEKQYLAKRETHHKKYFC